MYFMFFLCLSCFAFVKYVLCVVSVMWALLSLRCKTNFCVNGQWSIIFNFVWFLFFCYFDVLDRSKYDITILSFSCCSVWDMNQSCIQNLSLQFWQKKNKVWCLLSTFIFLVWFSWSSASSRTSFKTWRSLYIWPQRLDKVWPFQRPVLYRSFLCCVNMWINVNFDCWNMCRVFSQ